MGAAGVGTESTLPADGILFGLDEGVGHLVTPCKVDGFVRTSLVSTQKSGIVVVASAQTGIAVIFLTVEVDDTVCTRQACQFADQHGINTGICDVAFFDVYKECVADLLTQMIVRLLQ